MKSSTHCVVCVVGKVDEKRLTEQIQMLKKEKSDALAKMSELQKQVSSKINAIKAYSIYIKSATLKEVVIMFFYFKTEKLKENQKQSKESVSSTIKRIQDLEVSSKLEVESTCCVFTVFFLCIASLIFYRVKF